MRTHLALSSYPSSHSSRLTRRSHVSQRNARTNDRELTEENMKRAALFVLLFATLAPAAPAPDEYSINVHVTSSYRGAGGDLGQQMDVVIGGKKYQLSAGGNGFLLATGDYKAK